MTARIPISAKTHAVALVLGLLIAICVAAAPARAHDLRGCTHANNLFVADQTANTIREFSPNGVDLGNFATTGLNGPTGLAFDKHGNLYVSNINANTIRKFSPQRCGPGRFRIDRTGLTPWHRVRQARKPVCRKRHLDPRILTNGRRPRQLCHDRAERRARAGIRPARKSLRSQCRRQYDPGVLPNRGRSWASLLRPASSVPHTSPSTAAATWT